MTSKVLYYCNVPTLEVQKLLVKTLVENGFKDPYENNHQTLYRTRLIYENGRLGGNYKKDDIKSHTEAKKISLEEAFELKHKESFKVAGYEVSIKEDSVNIGCKEVPNDVIGRVMDAIRLPYKFDGEEITIDYINKTVWYGKKVEFSFEEVAQLYNRISH